MIRFRTLGALDLQDANGQELRSALAQPRRVALLAYLALATPRDWHSRDALLALFWPEYDADHARNALSQAVHFLRRSLAPNVIASRNGEALRFDSTEVWCDAVAFDEALEAGRTVEALDLYRGDLLEGFHVGDALEFERWLDGERTRYAGRYAQALETMAVACEQGRDFAGAVAYWRRLAARDRYSSRVTLRLMRALAAGADPAGALQHARIHETLLREELAIAPDAEVADLVRQLRSGQPKKPSGSTEHVPPFSPQRSEPDIDRQSATLRRVDYGRLRRRVAIMTVGLVALSAAAGWAAVLRSGRSDAPVIRSIAVLPFENLSRDSAERGLADGVHDELITDLARYPELSVISRTSVLRYRGTTKPLPEIAKELHVDGVVEGTLLREKGRVRMNAQLVHGPSDRHLWAQSYTRDLRDVLDLQREIAGAIAREIDVAAAPLATPRARSAGRPDSAPRELYLRELYLRGRHAENSRSLAGIQTAKEAYRRAVEQDSTFARGYAGLAGVYHLMADYAYAPMRPSLDTARMMALRAVQLDSTLPETRTALAVTLGDAGQFDAAERELKRAIELGPSNARAHYWYAVLLVGLGRAEEALREVNRAAELDPFPPRGLDGMRGYALHLLTGQRPPELQRTDPPILKLEPGEPWARARKATSLAEEGRCADARSEILLAQHLAPNNNFRMLPFVSTVYWHCGDRSRARALLRGMKQRPDARDNGYRLAILHTLFGEKDSALVWLEHQPRWTVGELSGLSGDVWLDPLRSDPRFTQMLRRIGIRPSSHASDKKPER